MLTHPDSVAHAYLGGFFSAGPSTQAASSDAAPRELPPWLQRQNGVQGTPASASLSQEVSGEFKDIKSASPEDEKKTEEVRSLHWPRPTLITWLFKYCRVAW